MGASISDPSGGNLDVIDVFDSHDFSLQGFTINGGSTSVFCGDFSVCRFSGNTVQGSAGGGIIIGRARAELSGNISSMCASYSVIEVCHLLASDRCR